MEIQSITVDGACICVKLIASMCVCKCVQLCVCVCACVRGPLRLLISSDVMWHDMDLYDCLSKFYSFYMASVVVINSGHDLRIEAHRSNYRIVGFCHG